MYKFIDITEAQSDTTLPSEAISVNGEYIEELLPGYRTLYTEGRELLESELTEIQIGNQNGTRYQYKRDVPREITVHYQILSNSPEDFREKFNELSRILDQEQMKINAGYIYNPLSFSSQQKSALTDKILLFVGRLERKQKGIDMLLDIAEELFHHRGYGDWKLRIIGNGSGYKDTEEDIRRHGLEDQVELLGEREEVIPFYREASVFVSTSRWEGFGLVITEAMECGLPVVSFRTDGPSEIIRDGQDGILIDNYRKGQFADALERLMTDGEQKAESDIEVCMNGAGSSAQIISRSVGKGNSSQVFHPKAVGKNKCHAHIQSDSIIMDHAEVGSIPEIQAKHVDAAIVHEAAIGRINDEQLLKLRTLGMTEAEAENVIIENFLS